MRRIIWRIRTIRIRIMKMKIRMNMRIINDKG